MKTFKMKGKHLNYPEILKLELDTVTRHGYEVVGIDKETLSLDESVETYNYLLDINTPQIREHIASTNCGYVEIAAKKVYFPLLGLSWFKFLPCTRENANYLMIKSPEKRVPSIYVERLRAHHGEETKRFGILSAIYLFLFGMNLLMQNKVVDKLGLIGYYVISAFIILFFITSFYAFLRHKTFLDELE